MFKKILELIELEIKISTQRLHQYYEQNLKWALKEKWDLETGEKFNDLISRYPISEDELLNISKTICKFVQITRIVNIDSYLFVDKNLEIPRLPFMLKNIDDKIWDKKRW